MKMDDLINNDEVQDLIRRALREDVGQADVTSIALVDDQARSRAYILARGAYILAGGPVADMVFRQMDPGLMVTLHAVDGQPVANGDCVAVIEGRARGILAGERVALNFLQRLTGIATLTRQLVERAAPHGVAILDTRKTTPTLRTLEKYAVRCGGGQNHRMGLYDRVLIKDNHIAFWRQHAAGNLADAVRAARARFPNLEIEIEVENLADLKLALPAQPDWILLDNMSPTQLRECVPLCKGICKVEASGGVTLETVEAIAQTGVDAISVGFLTHSAPAADLSLEFTAGVR